MPLHTQFSEPEAKEIRGQYRPFEEAKFQEVDKSFLEHLAECHGDPALLTQDAIRLKVPGNSSGTVKKYLPVVWALRKAEVEAAHAAAGNDDPLPAVTLGTRKVFEAVDALVDAMKKEHGKNNAAHHAQLAAVLAGQEGRLREEIDGRLKAEKEAFAVAAESEQRSAKIALLEQEATDHGVRDEVTAAQLKDVQRDLEMSLSSQRSMTAELEASRRTEAELRGDHAATRLELSAERQRRAEAAAARDEAIKARDNDAIRARAELDELRLQHLAELAESRAEVAEERKRNDELTVAVVAALKSVGKQPVEGALQ